MIDKFTGILQGRGCGVIDVLPFRSNARCTSVSWCTGRDLYLERGVQLRIVHATPITSVVCRLFTDTDVTDKSLCRMRWLMRVTWITGYVYHI